jgi:hypothetical protein
MTAEHVMIYEHHTMKLIWAKTIFTWDTIKKKPMTNLYVNSIPCFSKENQVQTYMHARIKLHAYSDV